MRVVRPSGGLLIVKVRPGILEGILALAIPSPLLLLFDFKGLNREDAMGFYLASAISAAVLSYIAEWSDFVFDGSVNRLRWVRRTVYRKESGEVAFGDITDVVVLESLKVDGDYKVRKVVLGTRSGFISLTRYSGSGFGSGRAAKAIVAFLNERGFHPPTR